MLSSIDMLPRRPWHLNILNGTDKSVSRFRFSAWRVDRFYLVIDGFPLQRRHNGRDGVSNHQPHNCLLKRLFRRRSKKISKHRVTELCVGNSPVTGEFPAQMASYAENISISWRHHGQRVPFAKKGYIASHHPLYELLPIGTRSVLIMKGKTENGVRVIELNLVAWNDKCYRSRVRQTSFKVYCPKMSI